jgi:hypothetical protein
MFHLCRHNPGSAQRIQQKIKCVLFRAFLSYKISDELGVDVLGERYKNQGVWNGLSWLGQGPLFVFL